MQAPEDPTLTLSAGYRTQSSTISNDLSNEEKGRILEAVVGRGIKSITIPRMCLYIVSRDNRKGKPKPDFGVLVFFNHRLILHILIEAHNFKLTYFVTPDMTARNTVMKFAHVKSCGLPVLRIIAGSALYTLDSQEILRDFEIHHVPVSQQVLSYDGEDFKNAVRQVRAGLTSLLLAYMVLHEPEKHNAGCMCVDSRRVERQFLECMGGKHCTGEIGVSYEEFTSFVKSVGELLTEGGVKPR
jgi:hypothetical protein